MRLLIIIFFAWFGLMGDVMAHREKITLGYIEKVTLVDHDLTLSAKLDTGAKSASLNAFKITPVEVKGQSYLRFIVPSKTGDVAFQCPYVGKVNIKVRVGETEVGSLFRSSINRPVVLMRVHLAGKDQLIRVNLTNRKRFIYPLLLGREAIIAFNSVVDPSLKYTTTIKSPVAKRVTHEI